MSNAPAPEGGLYPGPSGGLSGPYDKLHRNNWPLSEVFLDHLLENGL